MNKNYKCDMTENKTKFFKTISDEKNRHLLDTKYRYKYTQTKLKTLFK